MHWFLKTGTFYNVCPGVGGSKAMLFYWKVTFVPIHDSYRDLKKNPIVFLPSLFKWQNPTHKQILFLKNKRSYCLPFLSELQDITMVSVYSLHSL